MTEDELVIPVKNCEDCLHAKRKEIKAKNSQLCNDIACLNRENDRLKSQIEELKDRIEKQKVYCELSDMQVSVDNKLIRRYESDLKEYDKQIQDMKAQIEGMKNNIDGQKARKNHYMKENAELKAQIEKMKCCGNCKHWLDEDEMDKLPEELQLKYQECTYEQWYRRCQEWDVKE